MRYAIVTIGTQIKVDKTVPKTDILNVLYQRYHEFSTRTPIGNSANLYEGKKRLQDEFTSNYKSLFENYAESMNSDKLKYKGAAVVDFYFDKKIPNDDFIVVEFHTTEYTILDSSGDKILLAEGDLRNELKANEPTITNAFFLHITSKNILKTYIPY